MGDEGTHACEECGREGLSLLRCSGCKVSFFCDRNCQTLGWKGHKKACKVAAAAVEKEKEAAGEAPAEGSAQPAAPTHKLQKLMEEATKAMQARKFKEALEEFEECRRVAGEGGHADPGAICLYFMAAANQQLGQLNESKKLLDEFFETSFCKDCEPDENPIPQKAYGIAMNVHLGLGDVPAALRSGDEAVRLAAASGHRADHCELLQKVARVLYQVGDFAGAAERLEPAMELAAVLEGHYTAQYRLQGFNLSGAVYMQLGRYDDAAAAFKGEIEVAGGLGPRVAEQLPRAHANLAAAHIRAGAGQEGLAEEQVQRALEKARAGAGGGLQLEAQILGQLADAFRGAGNKARYVDMSKEVVRVAEESGDPEAVAEARQLLEEAEAS